MSLNVNTQPLSLSSFDLLSRFRLDMNTAVAKVGVTAIIGYCTIPEEEEKSK